MYRGIRLYEQAIIATNGDLSREAASAAFDTASIEHGPGGPAKVVPGTGHVAMNMYIAEAKSGVYEVVSKYDMVDPKECVT